MFEAKTPVTYQKTKTERGNAIVTLNGRRESAGPSATKRNHFYIITETEGTILVPAGELVAKA